MRKEDAKRALELFASLERLKRDLASLVEYKGDFHIGTEYSQYSLVPIESSIARQIAYNHFNDNIHAIKCRLKDLGFEIDEEKKEGNSIATSVAQEHAGQFFNDEALNRQYAETYGKWPKDEDTISCISGKGEAK